MRAAKAGARLLPPGIPPKLHSTLLFPLWQQPSLGLCRVIYGRVTSSRGSMCRRSLTFLCPVRGGQGSPGVSVQSCLFGDLRSWHKSRERFCSWAPSARPMAAGARSSQGGSGGGGMHSGRNPSLIPPDVVYTSRFSLQVTPGSKASAASLCPGDVILAIEGAPTKDMLHCEAQNKIKESTHRLSLTIERNESRLWSPQVVDQGRAHPFKINLEAEHQEYKPIGSAHNRKAQPFVAAANIDDKRQVVSATYNTPIGLYSSDNIQDAMEGQIRGLVHHRPESSRTLTNIEDSAVYQMLQKEQEEPHAPRQSGSFRALQDFIDSDGTRPIGTRTVKAPTIKQAPPTGNLQKLPICDKCGNGIVGTVVKARDKFRHPGCFVCSDCDVNLKQRGYFFVEGQLYCEAHARVRMRPPEGHDLVATFPSA